jgi:hypothetical protein
VSTTLYYGTLILGGSKLTLREDLVKNRIFEAIHVPPLTIEEDGLPNWLYFEDGNILDHLNNDSQVFLTNIKDFGRFNNETAPTTAGGSWNARVLFKSRAENSLLYQLITLPT